MQVMFDIIQIDNCLSSPPSSSEINGATVSRAIHKITHAWLGYCGPRISDLAFVTDDVAKMLKNGTYTVSPKK